MTVCWKGQRYHCAFEENSVNVHLHINLTLRKVKAEKNIINYCCHSQIHPPYPILPCVTFPQLHHPVFFPATISLVHFVKLS